MFLEVKNISKQFEHEEVVKQLNFGLEAHQTLSILGKSGCGKTTMLKIIAGLLEADSGEVLINEKNINHVPAADRGVVYLYQEDLLFPHLNVFENIAFGLRLKKVPLSQIEERVKAMIRSLELEGQQDKFPHQLSGGQRQRVSFGRAIIINPKVLLLDEPFGSLDTGTRSRMQELCKKLVAEFKITALFVTHDLKEAILMGDRLAYMEEGRIRVFEDKMAFFNEPRTGLGVELKFWKSLMENTKMKPES